jgi:hypothetical protein
MIASSTTPREESGKLSPTPTRGNKLNKFEYAKGHDGAEIIKISGEAAKALLAGKDCAFMGSETSSKTDGALIVDSIIL